MKGQTVPRWLLAAMVMFVISSVSWGADGKHAWKLEDSFGMKEIRRSFCLSCRKRTLRGTVPAPRFG
jgi:hypothetical protein